MLRLQKYAPWAGASHGDFEILKSYTLHFDI